MIAEVQVLPNFDDSHYDDDDDDGAVGDSVHANDIGVSCRKVHASEFHRSSCIRWSFSRQ